ncbi:hypothetical protein [Actinophytocola sp. NPDC049390]|uniref:hypothetical protein n=1 Tax=Actinophytocola sp. NPDC049390 TaxID=3363894 RepID=UPI00379EBE8A
MTRNELDQKLRKQRGYGLGERNPATLCTRDGGETYDTHVRQSAYWARLRKIVSGPAGLVGLKY